LYYYIFYIFSLLINGIFHTQLKIVSVYKSKVRLE
jgi:hypothetical protein